MATTEEFTFTKQKQRKLKKEKENKNLQKKNCKKYVSNKN